MNLVWANCRFFNQEGSAIMYLCNEAQLAFQERWLLSGLPSDGLIPNEPTSTARASATAQGDHKSAKAALTGKGDAKSRHGMGKAQAPTVILKLRGQVSLQACLR